MAIRDIICLGFGNGTYDPGVNKLPTLGYAIGEVVLATPMLVRAYGVYRAGPAAMDAYTAPDTSGTYTAGAQEYDQ
jgi:hypothetical protein